MIYIVRGVGQGPTEMAAYDSALADTNLHNYNLIAVSSIIPAQESVKIVDRAPDLGSAGNQLTVVEAKIVSPPKEEQAVTAGLGWATGSGSGIFYEATGTTPESVENEVLEGLNHGCNIRGSTFENRNSLFSTVETHSEEFTAAVVIAAYGESEPINDK